MTSEKPKQWRWSVILALLGPFILFVIVVTIMSVHMATTAPDTANLAPNALQDKTAPETLLPPLYHDQQSLDSRQFLGHVTLVNFWGSWCAPCRDEHPILLKLSQDKRFNIIGINFKDNPENAERFLHNFGNPFSIIGFDPAGAAAINWGVYGPPESFLVDKNNIIIYKHIGPLTLDIFQKEISPLITKAQLE